MCCNRTLFPHLSSILWEDRCLDSNFAVEVETFCMIVAIQRIGGKVAYQNEVFITESIACKMGPPMSTPLQACTCLRFVLRSGRLLEKHFYHIEACTYLHFVEKSGRLLERHFHLIEGCTCLEFVRKSGRLLEKHFHPIEACTGIQFVYSQADFLRSISYDSCTILLCPGGVASHAHKRCPARGSPLA